MGGKKRYAKQTLASQTQTPECKESGGDKRFVNLLHVYTIYKQKFRRLSKDEFEELIRQGCKGKRAAIALCKEFMSAKAIPDEVDFAKNVGFLSVPRLMPLVALLAERAGYRMKPSLVSDVVFTNTPLRFQEKFVHLMVDGFWFLGRVISDSLSVKEQVNRGNMFNFNKGDMGFWWAGVRILDWNLCAHRELAPEKCHSFLIRDPPKFRLFTNRAILNMHQHPLYFLSEEDWTNFKSTVQSVRHNRVTSESTSPSSLTSHSSYDESLWSGDSDSDVSTLSSEASLNTLASRESVD